MTFPEKNPPELDVARKGFILKAEQMLKPQVKMFGIPAMRKLAREITAWTDRECFEHLVIYATAPPQLPTSFEHSDGMRLAQADVLGNLGRKFDIKEWTDVAKAFEKSGELIKELCKAAIKHDAQNCSDLVTRIADVEEEAYGRLKV